MAAETGTQAIDRAAELLVSVVESTRPLGIGELSESAGLPKSTTSRLVGALERQGLVQRSATAARLHPAPCCSASRTATSARASSSSPRRR